MTDEESGRAEAEVVAETAEAPEAAPAPPDEAVERGTALALAGLHLRLGSLALARAELETLAGRGALDADARIDLAEVRWRTGDLVGAGEAAREALAGGGDAVVALVVAAEAASALGRPSEARRLAGQALSLNSGPIDPVFAGMPRSSVWPGDPAEPVPSPTTLFPPERSDSLIDADREGAALSAAGLTAADDRELADAAADADAAAVAQSGSSAGEPGLWDLHEAAAVAAAALVPGPPELEPSALFDAGRASLEADDRAMAAVHFGLVVRLAPALAPAVLSVIGDPTDTGLLFVQGDAYRAVGHETEARRAFAAARAAATGASTEPKPEAPPAAPAYAAPAETALWWLEPQREIESTDPAEAETEPAFEAEAFVEAEPSVEPETQWGEPPPAEAEPLPSAEPEPWAESSPTAPEAGHDEPEPTQAEPEAPQHEATQAETQETSELPMEAAPWPAEPEATQPEATQPEPWAAEPEATQPEPGAAEPPIETEPWLAQSELPPGPELPPEYEPPGEFDSAAEPEAPAEPEASGDQQVPAEPEPASDPEPSTEFRPGPMVEPDPSEPGTEPRPDDAEPPEGHHHRHDI